MKDPKQSTIIVELVNQAGCELWHTPDRVGYISMTYPDRVEHHPIGSKQARLYLNYLYQRTQGEAPGVTALGEARLTLEGLALFDGEQHPIHVRTADLDGASYFDLTDDRWRAVELKPDGWRIVARPPVRFRRSDNSLPIPEPVTGGGLDDLRAFVNVASESDWRLLVAWLLQAIRSTGPYPALFLHGQQGSSKSVLTRLLVKLVDPVKAELRRPPKDERDLAIRASRHWIITLENVSHISEWLSDALCALATGGGFGTRQLYTDDEEMVFDATRPVIANGIPDLATRPDLLDRAIPLTLPRIARRDRRNEREFWAELEAARPALLGALLTAVCSAMLVLPSVKLVELPRMADFAEFIVAAEPGLGWEPGEFMRDYDKNREDQLAVPLDSWLPAVHLRRFLDDMGGQWLGRMSQLYDTLTERVGGLARRTEWPKTAHHFGGDLRRLTEALAAAGIVVTVAKRNDGAWVELTDLNKGENSVTSVTASPPPTVYEHPTAPSDAGDAGDAVFPPVKVGPPAARTAPGPIGTKGAGFRFREPVADEGSEA